MVEGRAEDAVRALRQLVVHPIYVTMKAALAAAKLRLGTLLGGDEGEALRDEAVGWYAAQGVARPDRLAATHFPRLD
jgi:hypothetical protein